MTQPVGVAQVRAPEIAQGKDSVDTTHLSVEYLTSVVAATRQSELEEVPCQVGVHPLTISAGLRTPHPFFEGLQLLEVGPAQHPVRMAHSTLTGALPSNSVPQAWMTIRRSSVISRTV